MPSSSLVGKAYKTAYGGDNAGGIKLLRYYAGWADKISGKTIEVGSKFDSVSQNFC